MIVHIIWMKEQNMFTYILVRIVVVLHVGRCRSVQSQN